MGGVRRGAPNGEAFGHRSEAKGGGSAVKGDGGGDGQRLRLRIQHAPQALVHRRPTVQGLYRPHRRRLPTRRRLPRQRLLNPASATCNKSPNFIKPNYLMSDTCHNRHSGRFGSYCNGCQVALSPERRRGKR